jgi:hypothetical protein
MSKRDLKVDKFEHEFMEWTEYILFFFSFFLAAIHVYSVLSQRRIYLAYNSPFNREKCEIPG